MDNFKKMTIKHTGKGGDVKAVSAKHAAEILARREFGRKGEVRTFRCTDHAPDMSTATFQAFIGKPESPRKGADTATVGRNIIIWA